MENPMELRVKEDQSVLEATSMQGMAPQRSAFIALLLIVPAPTLGAAALFLFFPESTLGMAAYGLGKVVLYGLPIVWLFFVDREKPSLSTTEGTRGIGVGVLTGILFASTILSAFFFYGQARIDPELIKSITLDNGIGTPLRYIGACVWFAAINSLLEEYAFRWFIFSKCNRLMPSLVAVLLSGLIFTGHHIIVIKSYFDWDITVLGTLGVFIGGVSWSALYLKYRSIWPGYVSHIFADLAIFIIGWILIFE